MQISKTPSHVQVLLHTRIRRSQLSFLGFFIFTLILNVILSRWADPKDLSDSCRTNYGLNQGGNYTISHSMTGLYSKTFALALIFLCNLYYFSISHYQFTIYKLLIGHLYEDNLLEEDKARSMWRINSLAYGIATWSAIFLQCICIFDAFRFNKAHLVFAGLFFLFCLFYVILMIRNDQKLIDLGLSQGMDLFCKITFAGMILFKIVFVIGCMFDGWAEAHDHKSDDTGRWAKIVCAIGEYGYMIFCVIMVSSRAYSRVNFFDAYDFSELLNVKLFSVTTLLIDCAAGGEWLFVFGMKEEHSMSAMQIKQIDTEMAITPATTV